MKLLVSDYDKTYYTSDEDIIKNNNAVKNFMEHNLFVIATGRSYIDFNTVKEKYNIKFNYLIFDQGACILKDNKLLYVKYIDENILKEVYDILKTNIMFLCSGFKKVSVPKNITKINARFKDTDEAIKTREDLLKKYSKYINCYLINPVTIEITTSASSKEAAIKFIKNNLKIKGSDIYTVGDGYSDLNMIKLYNGFAIKNSIASKTLNVKKVSSVYEVIENEL